MTPRYREKLFDKRWLKRRKQILSRDNYACVICGKRKNSTEQKFIVHHKQYHYDKKKGKHSDPWNYDDRFLITLCESCHNRGHAKFEKIPIKYI